MAPVLSFERAAVSPPDGRRAAYARRVQPAPAGATFDQPRKHLHWDSLGVGSCGFLAKMLRGWRPAEAM